MKVDVKEKYFWFVYFELVCGFLASIAWMDYANVKINTDSNHDTYNVIHGVLISGGFFPVVFRSFLYTYNKDLGKGPFMTLMITALCMYILGGIIWLLDKGDAGRGVFGIATGGLLMTDMILKVMGK